MSDDIPHRSGLTIWLRKWTPAFGLFTERFRATSTTGFMTLLSSAERGYWSLRESFSGVQWASGLKRALDTTPRTDLHCHNSAAGLEPSRGNFWCVRNIDLVVVSKRDEVDRSFDIDEKLNLFGPQKYMFTCSRVTNDIYNYS